jgi:hypothetical protein
MQKRVNVKVSIMMGPEKEDRQTTNFSIGGTPVKRWQLHEEIQDCVGTLEPDEK